MRQNFALETSRWRGRFGGGGAVAAGGGGSGAAEGATVSAERVPGNRRWSAPAASPGAWEGTQRLSDGVLLRRECLGQDYSSTSSPRAQRRHGGRHG